jgi:hypothetical protein
MVPFGEVSFSSWDFGIFFKKGVLGLIGMGKVIPWNGSPIIIPYSF